MADRTPNRKETIELEGRIAKKPYSPPVVIEYGSLRDLTREQSENPTDGLLGTSPAA